VAKSAWKAAEIKARKEIEDAETEATKVWKAKEIVMQKAQLAVQERMAMAKVIIMNHKFFSKAQQ